MEPVVGVPGTGAIFPPHHKSIPYCALKAQIWSSIYLLHVCIVHCLWTWPNINYTVRTVVSSDHGWLFLDSGEAQWTNGWVAKCSQITGSRDGCIYSPHRCYLVTWCIALAYGRVHLGQIYGLLNLELNPNPSYLAIFFQTADLLEPNSSWRLDNLW